MEAEIESLVSITNRDPISVRQAYMQNNRDFNRTLDYLLTSSGPGQGHVPPTGANPTQAHTGSRPGEQHHGTGGGVDANDNDPKKRKGNGTQNTPGSAGNDFDAELQRAIEASKKDTKGALSSSENPGTLGMTKEEMETMKAVEMSMLAAKDDPTLLSTVVSDNPTFRKREGEGPVGLKNTGNTCYMNSMLQTYFMIPEVREAILSYPGDVVDNKDLNGYSKCAYDFACEMQKLFSSLILTNQKFVDPSKLFSKFVDQEGKPFNTGKQEDVGEANDLVLKHLAKAFEVCKGEKEKHLAETFKSMFYGQSLDIFGYKQPNGELKETENSVEFSTLMVPVSGHEPMDIFDGLDKFLVSESEYKLDSGETTIATTAHWFKTLPSVVMIQENRVQYDEVTKSQVKRETPVLFEHDIYLDRYLLDNKSVTTERRQVVGKLKLELSKLKEELKTYTHYKGTNIGIDESLKNVIEFAKDKSKTDEHWISIVKQLENSLESETKIMVSLRQKIKEIEEKISSMYTDMKTRRYSLYGVWLHQGVAGSGHYWAYIKNTNSDTKWIKFDDVRVSEVEEKQVLDESIGGGSRSHTSAYFLIYVENKDGKRYQKISYDLKFSLEKIPKEVQKQIVADNEKFTKEVEEYEKKHQDKFSQFMTKYQATVQDVQKLVADKDNLVESCLKSLPAFLSYLGRDDIMISSVVHDLYKSIFSRTFSEDIGSGIHDKLKERLSDELFSQIIAQTLDDKEKQVIVADHKFLREVSVFVQDGLIALGARRYTEALSHFYWSWFSNHNLRFENSKVLFGRKIIEYLSLTIKQMLVSIANDFSPVKVGQLNMILSALKSPIFEGKVEGDELKKEFEKLLVKQIEDGVLADKYDNVTLANETLEHLTAASNTKPNAFAAPMMAADRVAESQFEGYSKKFTENTKNVESLYKDNLEWLRSIAPNPVPMLVEIPSPSKAESKP